MLEQVRDEGQVRRLSGLTASSASRSVATASTAARAATAAVIPGALPAPLTRRLFTSRQRRGLLLVVLYLFQREGSCVLLLVLLFDALVNARARALLFVCALLVAGSVERFLFQVFQVVLISMGVDRIEVILILIDDLFFQQAGAGRETL